MKGRRNDDDRQQFIDNDEGLYDWWRRAPETTMRAFIRANRGAIDKVIDNVVGGSQPAHYLAYGPTRPLF